MTAQRIDYTNIYSQPSINIFSIIDTRSNIPDPKDSTGARIFVYNSDPFQKSFNFKGIPYIVVEDARPSLPTNKSANGKIQTLSWTQTIIVRTAKDGSSGSTADTGTTEMRQIVDDIFQTFNSATIKQTLRDYDQYNVDVTITNIDSTTITQNVLYETTLEIEYMTRLAVSV